MQIYKLGKILKALSIGEEKEMNHKLKEKDLSVTQGFVLVWLSAEKSKELPIKVIEKNFGTAQSTTLGIVNRLEQKGLITTYLTQQRTKHVKITDDGENLVEFIYSSIIETENILLHNFSEAEANQFISFLQRAEHNLINYWKQKENI